MPPGQPLGTGVGRARARTRVALERVRDRDVGGEPVVGVDRERIGDVGPAVVVVVGVEPIGDEVAVPVVRNVGSRAGIGPVRDLVRVRVAVVVLVERRAVAPGARRRRTAAVVARFEHVDRVELEVRYPDRARERAGVALHRDVDRVAAEVREQRLGRDAPSFRFRPSSPGTRCRGRCRPAGRRSAGSRDSKPCTPPSPVVPLGNVAMRPVVGGVAVVALDRVRGRHRRLRVRRVERCWRGSHASGSGARRSSRTCRTCSESSSWTPGSCGAFVHVPFVPSPMGTSPHPAFGPLSIVSSLPACVRTSANGLRKPGRVDLHRTARRDLRLSLAVVAAERARPSPGWSSSTSVGRS